MQKQWMRHNMVILHASQLEPSRLLQTLSLWVLPPIALKTRPLETMKVTATDAIVVPAQEAALVNVMIVGTTNKSQPLVIAWAKIIILTLVTNLGPLLVGLKTQTMTATKQWHLGTEAGMWARYFLLTKARMFNVPCEAKSTSVQVFVVPTASKSATIEDNQHDSLATENIALKKNSKCLIFNLSRSSPVLLSWRVFGWRRGKWSQSTTKMPLDGKNTMIIMVLSAPKWRSSLDRGSQPWKTNRNSCTISGSIQRICLIATLVIQVGLKTEYRI